MQYVQDIVAVVKENSDFRREVATGRQFQVAAMSLSPGEETGEHFRQLEKILVIVEGEGKVLINGEGSDVRTGSLVLFPAESVHNLTNTGSGPLKFYKIYTPPMLAPGTVQTTKAVADESEGMVT